MLKKLLLVAAAIHLLPVGLFAWEATGWKAGLAKVVITPRQSIWLSGYGARTKPSEGTSQELYAKALALEDSTGYRAVLVTTDLVGMPATVSRNITERVQQRYHLPRDRVLLNFSHTHAGPMVGRMFPVGFLLTDADWAVVDDYTPQLEGLVVKVIGQALKRLEPARVGFTHTSAGFGANRRRKTDKGYDIGLNKNGPVDHDVPVLQITGKRGNLLGLVFGYACHNTTIGGNYYQFNGDYAGYAQKWLEDHHPGATAMFVNGCGADADPFPRGSVDLARQHGEELASAVEKTVGQTVQPIRGPLKSAWEEFPVDFATPPSREEWRARLASDDKDIRLHAELMLKALDRDGRLPSKYPYPLQVWQFGSDLTLVAMSGECVVDYTLRLKQELGERGLWVAGYSNDVFAYIPSLRVLREGGYEAGGANIYYGQPGPFAPSIEETIIKKVHEVVARLRAK